MLLSISAKEEKKRLRSDSHVVHWEDKIKLTPGHGKPQLVVSAAGCINC